MSEIPKGSMPNYLTPGDNFNPHHESGNIGAGPSFMGDRGKMVNFQSDDEIIDPNEEAIASRYGLNSRESLSAEMVSLAETPDELFEGIRDIMNRIEDGKVPPSLENRYALTSLFDRMRERADNLRKTTDELMASKKLLKYDDKTGIGIPRKERYAQYAISSNIEYDKSGRYVKRVEYNFGTKKEREQMVKAYDKAILEVEARVILGEQVGPRLNPEIRDGLENIVALLRSGRMPKFKAEHLSALFNMPSVSELQKSPESRELGDQVEKAMFLNLIMLNSGTKKKMQDLLDRPGSKYLIAVMAKEEGNRRGVEYKSEQWIADNIGNLSNWVDDELRELDTWEMEVADGHRKGVARWSNIAAAVPKGFGVNQENEFIEDIIGRLSGSKEASWIAATIMKSIGAYASEGYVALPNGKLALALGEDGYISGDDTGKFWAYMQTLKEGLKNRSSFMKLMIGKVPDMAMNMFDWMQLSVPNPNGTGMVQRSVWDAWLGTAGGKRLINLETQKESTNPNDVTVQEDYNRLGDLDFGSLARDFHGKFATMQWLMGSGREPTGVLTEANKVDLKPEDFELNDLKKKWKYVGIVYNEIVLSKGSPHLYIIEQDTKDAKGKITRPGSALTIQRNYFRNLLYARLHSASFTKGILPSKTKMFNANGVEHDVYNAVLIRANIEEALKLPPVDYEELLKHYIDENDEILDSGEKMLGLVSVPGGTSEDVLKLLKADFLPKDKQERERAQNFGRVTGKTNF